jgi:hypothetical protein
MRVTIVVDDNVVLVEDQPEKVDCSALIAQDIHAVQWYGTAGEIEYITDMVTGQRRPNTAVSDFSPFQFLVDAWTVAVNTPAPPIPTPPTPPPAVLPQDLMAQFIPADMVKIMAAMSGDTTGQISLLWYSMQAHRDPMETTNARFLAGWAALTQVLGAPRMAVIAAALNVTVG